MSSWPSYKVIADCLEADIRAGRLQEGQPLAPQRELAARYGRSVFVISQACTLLVERGYLTKAGQTTRMIVALPAPEAPKPFNGLMSWYAG